MTIQYAPGTERKKLAAALAARLAMKSTYSGAPRFEYIVDNFTITKDGALTGPDNHELVEALRQLSFEPTAEAYDSEPETGEPEAVEPGQPEQPGRLTIEVPIGREFTAAKMDNLEKLIASRDTLLKKVLGTDTLPIEQTDGVLKFPWFPVDGNAMVYSQLACALVRVATEATRITARERPCESERFHMRTYLLKIGFIGDEFKQARAVLTRGLSGSGSYAKPKAITGEKGSADNA